MDATERLHWLETRILSSLRPRADDLRRIFSRDDSRATFLEFFANDDAHRLFVYSASEGNALPSLKVSLSCPVVVSEKCICFVKTGLASQLHAGNLDDSITCLDWSNALSHGDLLVREVFLPLLCTGSDVVNQATEEGMPITSDKLMDVLHRLLGNIEITRGISEGKVCLPLPSIEVLAEAAAFQNRQPAVVHVLESAVIGWIRQIRNVLRHDPLSSTRKLSHEAGEPVRPHHEVEMWEQHIQHMSSILEQLKAPVATDILMNLTHANSTYAQSFGTVHAEIERALENAKCRLRCFTTVLPWIQDMYRTSSVSRMLKVFPPLLHTVLLIWKHSDYYHDVQVFAHLLQMLSNEVVARARSLVGNNPFEDTQRSYTALKDALRLCAAFRGTYLDFKETANAINQKKIESNVISMSRIRPKDHNVLFRAKMYGPTGFQQLPDDPQVDGSEEHWEDSAWPPRNTACFGGLSKFVERCNDLLDLVETTRHFCTLEEAARVGGAGSRALDALVNDIHQVFTHTIREFTKKNQDVLTIDEKQHFEKAFFHYRSVIKTLEHRLAGVIRKALSICPNPMSHLRILEVFEGISARELLQRELAPENEALVTELTVEFKSVKRMFREDVKNVPRHANMPPTVSKLFWIRSLKERIGVPMNKLRIVCPHILESDKGWMLRDVYTDVMNVLEKFESRLLTSWRQSIDTEIRDRLKNFILAPADEDKIEGESKPNEETAPDTSPEQTGESPSPRDRATSLKVNLDPKLLVMLRDVHYLQKPPYDVPIPASVRALLRSVDSSVLHRQATRLHTVISKYNHIIKSMKQHELLLFENKMRRVDELVNEGKESVTWGSPDKEDYLEKVTAVISEDVYRSLTRVHNNWARVEELALSWSEGELGIFTSRTTRNETHNLKELLVMQEEMDQQYRSKLIPAGIEIHRLLQNSFEAIEMSAASPAWQLYTAQMDAVVLVALKNSMLTSLDAMYTVVAISEDERLPPPPSEPILTIRLELVEQTVSFSPPLDRSSSVDNVEDATNQWLETYLRRANLVNHLTDPANSYADILSNDSDVWEVMEEIQTVVVENASDCKELLSIFDNYKFLWVQDVQQSFQDFLNGRPSPNPLRTSKQSKHIMSRQTGEPGQRSRFSMNSPDATTEAERAFLTPHHGLGGTRGETVGLDSRGRAGQRVVSSSDLGVDATIPGLAEFDEEIGIYKDARDNISSLSDFRMVGWLRINFQPIKQVLTTYASKWMWTFTKYLCDQVTDSLDTLADFLARTEPEIESITGEERDTASFMKMMRLFNEVSAQQQDMEERFSVMRRTVGLLEKYDMKLSAETQQMFYSAPDRWNHLKTKVSLAKQRLGPRIQEESARITKDLLRFGDRMESLASELRSSEVFSRECPIHAAMETIDGFQRRLKLLQTEAQDLIELQELLETAVFNFSVLPQYQRDLKNLKISWEQKRICEAEQRDWKLKHWQKIDTKQLQMATRRQKEQIQSLPPEVTEWDVYQGMIDSIIVVEQCLPLVEDLNNPAMRTRHWKQLVRVTGGLLQTDTDSLRKMVLGDLLELGLQKHADEVKAIVQRAVKDLTIENSLKTCEEVWLGKVFEVQPHTRGLSRAQSAELEAGSELTGSEMMPHAVLQPFEGSRTTGGTRTKSMKSGPHSRSSDKTGPGSVSRGRAGGRTSVLSLPVSLVNLVDDPSPICLLKNVNKILSELEHHQIELNRMQSNSAIGSFLDEVTKWQKRLQLVEAVLESWVSVQEKWVQLDEIYSGADVRTALAHEANMFAVMSKDFRLLMRATEKNTNVLQSCSRKGLLPMLEKMDNKMEHCKHALLGNLERRRQRFPRFYFLSPEDVMNIVCYGYDLNAVNKYLSKILRNLGRLMFEEQDAPASSKSKTLAPGSVKGPICAAAPKKYFLVKGVSSTAGENLILSKVLPYEGPMSQWLPRLIEGIKITLQEQLHVALGFEARPAQIEREVRSAGASKVRVSRPSSAASQRSGGSNRAEAVKATELKKAVTNLNDGPSDLASQLSRSLGMSVPLEQVSWTLDNATQVVLLATSVQMAKKLAEAVNEQDTKTQALRLLCDKTQESLDAAVIMLKGTEDEKTSRMRSAYRKSSRGKDKTADGTSGAKKDAYSESIGAPSTRSSLENETEGGDDEESNEDGAGEAAPINTMQSLLFTEQLQSNSRGAHGERLDVDLPEISPQEATEVTPTTVNTKLLLFPAQIQKISSLIASLAQHRDIFRSMKINTDNIAKSFEYQSRLKHIYNDDAMEVSVQLLSWEFGYGFEYQGSCTRHIISPSCDSVILSVCHALHYQTGVLLVSPSSSNKTTARSETLSELANQMGRALYSVLCTSSVDHYMLGDLFKGLSETGCWLCLEHLSSLSQGILAVACQLADDVRNALHLKKPALTLQNEEVALTSTAAFFATIDYSENYSMPLKMFTPFQMTPAWLPANCLKTFRIVNASCPDPKAVLEIRLLAQGFTQAPEMAHKLFLLLKMSGSLFSTLPAKPVQSENFPDVNGNYVASLRALETIICSAGVALDALIHNQMEKKQEYKEMVATKARKFAELWKHKSSTSAGSMVLDSGGDTDGEFTTSSSTQNQPPPGLSNQRIELEEDAEAMRKMEEEALVTAIRNQLAPRMFREADRNLLITLVQDLWPDVEIDFGMDNEDQDYDENTRKEIGWGADLNTEVSIPVHQRESDTLPFQTKRPSHEPIDNVEAAIAVATAEKKLTPASDFQSRVAQMLELAESMQAVVVAGPSGCGKSSCVRLYSETQRQLGLEVTCKRVFLNALNSSKQLFGYYDLDTRDWKDGLIQHLLRPYCLETADNQKALAGPQQRLFVLHLDGILDLSDLDMFLQLLRGSGSKADGSKIMLPNNERLNIPYGLRIVWEMESLAQLSPSTVAELGVLAFRGSEITWKVHIVHWLDQLPEAIQEVLKSLLDFYLPKVIDYFAKGTTPSHLSSFQNGQRHSSLKQTVKVSLQAMTVSFCRLLNCLMSSTSSYDVSQNECECYVGYAAFWAFGGTLEAQCRDMFAAWWQEQWPNLFPDRYNPWNVFVDSDTRDFADWADHIPQFSGFVHGGGHPSSSSAGGQSSQDEQQRQQQQDEVFVHSPDTEQLTHILGMLTDAGYPVLIAGPPGCGKTALVRERVNTVSSGEVAEVLSLFIHCNRLIEAGGLWERISNHLEWKYGITYTPRGNKKLLCVVDDLSLSRPLESTQHSLQLQSACEIIRQHLDTGGVRNISTFKWQQVSNVAYIATTDPHPTGTSCPMSQRLTRHFSIFTCPFPSVSAQHSIFSAILNSHFLSSFGNNTSHQDIDFSGERPMQNLLDKLTMVTIELQERLRYMYLSIPERAHYAFTLNDLDKIFRNLILSLRQDVHHKELLLLWRHECDWTYGRKMVSDVDLERYQQALDTAVRKYLTENEYLPLVVAAKQPTFSSVRELDSGLVTAGRYVGRSSQTSRNKMTSSSQDVGDYYKPAADKHEVHRLMMEAVKEYNKINVQMNMSMYDSTIETVCRIARIIQSPHKIGHTLLFGDGCPVLARLTVNLASHLGGFRVMSLTPALATPDHTVIDTDHAKLEHFKQFLVKLYNLTGVKGEKIVLYLHDDKVLTHECLAVTGELIRHGAISHLFTVDEQTTIANSVRSEVTAAGLTYSRDAAWNFFQSMVMKNLRIVFVCSDTGEKFTAKRLEFASLFNHLNIIAMRPWSHEQLVHNTLYHIQSQGSGKCCLDANETGFEKVQRYRPRKRLPMNKKWMENVAHLLANMHIAVRQKAENKFYKLPGNVSNYAYEKFVLRFVNIFRQRRRAVCDNQLATAEALSNIDRENDIAETLQKALDREKQVLEEHKAGTSQLLAQIGQDMVITEQQVLAVKQQIKKIHHLKKSLPEYQLAHEKAVFKAAAIVADTKKVVKEIDVQGLSELRSLQKPDQDVEDLMACIIMILKSSNSDLTWSKGAKRQMANLDRFIDELMNFDDTPLPQTTLNALDGPLEKETFTVENLTAKAGGNLAAGSLVKWVQGVVRYHSLMISKVKPLHDKLQETSSAIVDAQHKLRQLESKKTALEARLYDLGEGFEQATADKNEQEEKRAEMQERLREASHFQQVLVEEHTRRTAVLHACEDQLEWVTGVSSIAAGFSTYLGPYPYMFRRMLLTIDWAQCLVERGILLVFDSIDPVRGHRIEFMLNIHEGLPDASLEEESNTEEGQDQDKVDESDEAERRESIASGSLQQTQSDSQEASVKHTSSSEEQTVTESNTAVNLPAVEEETDADDEGEGGKDQSLQDKSNDNVHDTARSKDEEKQNEGRLTSLAAVPVYTFSTLPFISTEEFQMFVGSIVKVLVGEETMQAWLTKDFSHHQLQNASILHSSWQRPPLLLDPYLAGADWYASMMCQDRKIVPINLSSRTDQSQVVSIEKAIIGGHTLMLMDCEQQSGNLLRPLIYLENTSWSSKDLDESRTVRFLGRRLVCPESFRFCMSTTQPASNLHPDITAASQLVSYIPSTETLQEDLLNRALSRVRPQIFAERKYVMHAIRQHRRTLSQLDNILSSKLVSDFESQQIENCTKFILSVVELKQQVSQELQSVENLLANLNELTEELFPIAQRGAQLYTICRSLPSLNPHYQIPLPFFLHLFDTTVGSDSDEEGADERELTDVRIVKPYLDGDDSKENFDDEKGRMDMKALQERRRSKLRLGSASKVIKRAQIPDDDLEETSEEGTNADSSSNELSEKPTERIPAEEEDSEEELLRKREQCDIVIPVVEQLPSEDTPYDSFSSDEVKKIVDVLTKRVFEYIYYSVQPEHQLPAATLALLSIELDASIGQEENGDADDPEDEEKKQSGISNKQAIFSEEELTLLIHGNPGFGAGVNISLQDFECQAPVPTWMSADHWEDLLAFSFLPGPLEGICVEVAQCADHWREWYECPNPENETLPQRTGFADENNDGSRLPELSDFHNLLLIRTLRPDRLFPALRKYLQQHVVGTSLEDTILSSSSLSNDVMFKDIQNTLGVLVLLPNEQEPDIQTNIPMSPTEAIKKLALRLKINVNVISVGDGCQQEVTRVIEQAHTDDSWVIIDGLHLAPAKFYEELQLNLARIGNISRASGPMGESNASEDDAAPEGLRQSKTPRFLAWLTSLPNPELPPTLTQYLYKISWKSLIQVASESKSNFHASLDSAPEYKKALICLLQKIPAEVIQNLSNIEATLQRIMYVVCVCHTVAVTGQCFGWHGLTKRYALCDSVLHQALSYLNQDFNPAHFVSLVKNLYSDIITCSQDKDLVNKLFEEILLQVVKNPDANRIFFNTIYIPVPPSSISPADYGEWAMNELPDDVKSTDFSSVHSSAVQWKTTEKSKILLKELQDLFSASQQPGSETSIATSCSIDPKPVITLLLLQTSMDMCFEQLPPLLELGRSQTQFLADFDFPYHRPSLLNVSQPSDMPLPECVSFALMQECLWFNYQLCHVRQQLHGLKTNLLLTSGYELPQDLQKTATALIAEDIPPSWLHPNDHPSTHTLLTWLADMNQRHKQFQSWIRGGMVPSGTNTPVGKLSSVWLGGLVNPNALLTAMCHEKAVTHDSTFDKVKLKCQVINDSDGSDTLVTDHEPSMFLKSIHALNTAWNSDKECMAPLNPNQSQMNELPAIYLYPVIKDEDEDEEDVPSKKDCKLHDFPVYMNASRQFLVCYLPLATTASSNVQTASLILQTGLDATKRDMCKSRTFLARKRRDEWDKVSPEVSELMSRSGTRMSSTHHSISGYRMSMASLVPPGPGKAGSTTDKHGSVVSHSTGSQLHVPTLPRKGKRGSLASSFQGQSLETASKMKSSSQHSLTSSNASTNVPASQAQKPPSRVQEEQEEGGSEAEKDENVSGSSADENKPLPNGRILHNEPPSNGRNGGEGSERPSSGGAVDPSGVQEAIDGGVVPKDFFEIKHAPSTEASLLQSILDGEERDGDGSDDEDGSQHSHESQPSVTDRTDRAEYEKGSDVDRTDVPE